MIKTTRGWWLAGVVCLGILGLGTCAVAQDEPAKSISRHREYEPENPAPPEVGQQWEAVPDGLHAAFGSVDRRYDREVPPDDAQATAWQGVAWRGERLNAQAVVWSKTGAEQVRVVPGPLTTDTGATLPASCVTPSFVRYVLADGKLVPDVLDRLERIEVPAQSARPVWLRVDVPPDAQPGLYRGVVEVRAAGGVSVPLEVGVEVLPLTLPAPAEWAFRLDLWQNPWAVARYHGVEPWSDAHWQLLRPHLRMLAEAGQKCITTAIVHDPWKSQTYDPYGTMVEWIRGGDGSWQFDFSLFDQYIQFAMDCGITDSINCYSMVPWSNRFRFFDEATGDYQWVEAEPGTPEHAAHWRPFLEAFVAHLKERGWLGRTNIAMDERPPEQMEPAIALIREAAPGLGIALAGKNDPELSDAIRDWCVFIEPPLDPAIARERAERGVPTTYYVCCGPADPNTFTFSPPAESAWLGWYAAAQDYTGLLRWAYDSWVEDPLRDTSYVTWPAGDCFLVYPGARSSIRFERLREGIQDYEKIRLLRRALAPRSDNGAHDALIALDAALKGFTVEAVRESGAAEAVRAGKAVVESASRVAANR